MPSRTGATGSTRTSTCCPADAYDGMARLTIVGGVDTDEIDPATGVTQPVAHIAYNSAVLDSRGCPFAGRVHRAGPTDPALAGASYGSWCAT